MPLIGAGCLGAADGQRGGHGRGRYRYLHGRGVSRGDADSHGEDLETLALDAADWALGTADNDLKQLEASLELPSRSFAGRKHQASTPGSSSSSRYSRMSETQAMRMVDAPGTVRQLVQMMAPNIRPARCDSP
jgi:hypothetical protein